MPVFRAQRLREARALTLAVDCPPEVLTTSEAAAFLRGPFVLCQADGEPLRLTQTRKVIPRLCKTAGIDDYSWHPLRHTFCSHLAMKGAPAKTIQELAGHADLSTTLKYMHLAAGAKEQAIALLEAPWQKYGKNVEATR